MKDHQSQARVNRTPPPQAGRFLDHGGTVFFSLFMALWAMPLREFWEGRAPHWPAAGAALTTRTSRWVVPRQRPLPERAPPLSTGSPPGAAEAPVCRLCSHNSCEPRRR